MKLKIVKQSDCEHCDGSGTVSEADPSRPGKDVHFPCSRCLPDDQCEEDFIQSDNCHECNGSGYTWLMHENPQADNEKEQCEECERLHKLELRADRMHDEAKGN